MNTLFKYLLLFILLLSFSACSAEIESSSANSISAILAVCGEYIFAIISLVILFLIHCVRVVGIALSTMSIYMLFCNIRFENFCTSWLLLIGCLLILISFLMPIKIYEPKVVIARNLSKIRAHQSEKKSQVPLAIEIIVGIIIGVVLIILEQNIDFTFVN